jgi:hypothetical protein
MENRTVRELFLGGGYGAGGEAAKNISRFQQKAARFCAFPDNECFAAPDQTAAEHREGTPATGGRDPAPAFACNHLFVLVHPGNKSHIQKAPMNAFRNRDFPRRLDENGNYHSICLNCFQTVATSYSQQALVEIEKQHICKIPLSLRMGKPPAADATTDGWPRLFRM